MSKSLGNFITIRDILKKYDLEVLRFFFASAHYRSVVDFNEGNLKQAKASLETLYETIYNVQKLTPVEEIQEDEKELETKLLGSRRKFIEAMDDDFNTPLALSTLFEISNEINKCVYGRKTMNKKLLRRITATFKELGGILNILQKETQLANAEVVNKLVTVLVDLRQKLRKKRDWQKSDMIREKLGSIGITLQDTSDGTLWKFEKTSKISSQN